MTGKGCITGALKPPHLYLNSLLKGPVQFLFYFLLQEARGFRLLHSGGGGLEAAVVASGVTLVHLRSVLLVNADNDHTCRQHSVLARSSHKTRQRVRLHVYTYNNPVVAFPRSACTLERCRQFSYRACPLESHNRTCTASWRPRNELAGLVICCQLSVTRDWTLFYLHFKPNKVVNMHPC